PGLGEATFVQAAGFLKITGGNNPLDATWIHPESYAAAARLLEQLGCGPADLVDKEATAALSERTAGIDLDAKAKDLDVGALTLKDILSQLARPGRDPREDLPPPIFRQGVLKLEDLTAGMELSGTVLNVVDFGCFVDIGMHDSGLVHVSRLADRFIRDPHEVVAVGDVVKVWVMEVDKERRRVSLTMVRPGSERSRRPRQEEKAAEKPADGPRPEASERRPPRKPGPPPSRPPEARRGRPQGPPSGRPRVADRPSSRPPARPPQPKPRPKPLIPITDAMKTGKEPMRTFGDLMQFFEVKQEDPVAKPAQQPEPMPALPEPEPPVEAPPPEPEPPVEAPAPVEPKEP
ncbi:MAG: S1 RNA-binding domain-containing protein, partial [Thermoguttaceae bacterium]